MTGSRPAREQRPPGRSPVVRRAAAAVVLVASVSVGCTGSDASDSSPTDPTIGPSGQVEVVSAGDARVWLLRGCALLGLSRVSEALNAFERSSTIIYPELEQLVTSIEVADDPSVLAQQAPCPT